MNGSDIKFGLRKISTGEFATIDSVAVQEDAIRLNFSVGLVISEEQRMIDCNTKFEFLSKEVPFIVLNVQCAFQIAPDSWESFINKESKTIVIPVSFSTHLAFLTVGTARGILHSKTENTPFNKYFLPTLNISNIIKNDIIIESKKL